MKHPLTNMSKNQKHTKKHKLRKEKWKPVLRKEKLKHKLRKEKWKLVLRKEKWKPVLRKEKSLRRDILGVARLSKDKLSKLFLLIPRRMGFKATISIYSWSNQGSSTDPNTRRNTNKKRTSLSICWV